MASEEVTIPLPPSPIEDEDITNNQCSLEGCIEDSSQSELTCLICNETLKNPKMLSCFHTFCLACLEQSVENESAPIDGEPTKPVEALNCPSCKQKTILPDGKSENLMTNLMAEEALNPETGSTVIICSSCKAKEQAIARCAKCPNFLCSHCTTAHQFMRCFEHHVVELFEDILKAGGSIISQKPVPCLKHKDENLTHFCNLCEVAVCLKCIAIEHPQPEHVSVILSDVERQNAEELQTIATQGRGKLEKSQETTQALAVELSELQEQNDNAKSLINETFQSYKSFLEKWKDKCLSELEERHSSQELLLMEAYHESSVNESKLEDACTFIEKILKDDCRTYVSIYKKMIHAQMLSLLNNSLKSNVSTTIEFKTDAAAFEAAMKQTFGWFVKEDSKKSLQSCFEKDAAFTRMTAANVLTAEQLVGHVSTETEFLSSPLPTLPSVDQLAALNGNLESLSTLASVASSLASAPPIPPLESALSRVSVSPVMSDSGISVDAASTNSNNSNTMMNIAVLSSMGAHGLNSQAMISNSMCDVSASSASTVSAGSSSTSRTQTPMGQNVDTMHSILSVSPTQQVQQVQTGNLEQLANLFQSQPPPPTLNSLPFNAVGPLEISPSTGNGSDVANPALSPSSSSSYSGNGASGPYPPVRRPNKMSAMQIRCKFGQLGPGKCQFNSPHGFCLGMEQDIIVADTNNHRVQVFEKNGEFKAQFGIPGREEGQLWYPRKVAVMRNSGKFVVCDRGNERSRMQIFTRTGHFLKKIAIRYIDIVAGLAITTSGNIVAVDSVSPTVFVIGEGGDLVKWFDCSDYMREPSDIAVSNKEYFVCDFKGHCVVVFNEEGQFLRRIGCENITNYPNGIDISDAGDVLIGDSHGNRFHVAVFQRDGSLIGEFQCPYVKVSRCCGLKITSEGYIVTLAKNNHHVLVLNTLYIA